MDKTIEKLVEIQQRWGWLWKKLNTSHLTVAGILHLWEWYGMLDQLPSTDWISEDVARENVLIAYRELYRFLSTLSYSECVALVNAGINLAKQYDYSLQVTVQNCAALIDWHDDDVERWLGENCLWGLDALARRGEASDYRVLYRLETHALHHHYCAQYEAGLLAWLHMVAYQRHDLGQLCARFRSWRNNERGPGNSISARGYTYELRYLPPNPLHLLDQALQEVVISQRLTGKVKLLLQQFGPSLYGDLLTTVILHAEQTSTASLAASHWVVQQIREAREDKLHLRDLLCLISPGQRLNVALSSYCPPEHVVQELLNSLHVENIEELQTIIHFLRQPFPADLPIPPAHDPALLEALISFASGFPGDEVTLHPDQYKLRYAESRPGAPIKQARLLLCAQGYYPKQQILEVAHHAYDLARTYRAHEAVAGAFVHPEVSQQEKNELAAWLRTNDLAHTYSQHPDRFRQRSNELFRWGRTNGWLPSW